MFIPGTKNLTEFVMNLKLLTQTDVMVKIDALGVAAKALQADIHLCAVSTLDHVRAHGDHRGVTALLNALPNGQRVKGLAAWYRAMSSGKLTLKVDKETKQWACDLSKDRVDADFKMEEAETTDFGAYTAEREPVTMTLASFIKRVETIANNDEMNADGSPKVEPEARILAAETVAFLRTKQITMPKKAA